MAIHYKNFWQKLMVLLFSMSVFILGFCYALDMSQIELTFKKMGGKPNELTEWQNLLRDAKSLPLEEKLKTVNNFFNRHINDGSDMDVYGVEDYWATPMKSLSRNRGDCEDYAIAKYYVLRELKIPDNQLRLIYVKATYQKNGATIQESHMVLAFYNSPDEEPMILDNLNKELRSASQRPDLVPVFSFNSEAIYKGAAGNAKSSGGAGQLSRWADLIQRARAEGF